jgi:hypothetical protein
MEIQWFTVSQHLTQEKFRNEQAIYEPGWGGVPVEIVDEASLVADRIFRQMAHIASL